MTHFRFITLFGTLCLLMAGTAIGQTTDVGIGMSGPVPPPPNYDFFPTSITVIHGVTQVNNASAVVGYSAYDPVNGDPAQNYFLNPSTATLTFSTDGEWPGDMYAYNGSIVNLSGGDPSNPTASPGGHISGTLYLNDSSKANLSSLGYVSSVAAYDQSSVNMSGGTMGYLADTGKYLGGISLNSPGCSANISGGTLHGGIYIAAGTASISGGQIDGVETVNNGSTVTVSGGLIADVFADFGATATISAGSDITGEVGASVGGSVSMDGGTAGALVAEGDPTEGTTRILMSDGVITGSVEADGGGQIGIKAGSVGGSVTANSQSQIGLVAVTVAGGATENSSTLNIVGATITGDVVAQDGQIDMEGGSINGVLSANGNALVTLGSGSARALHANGTSSAIMTGGTVNQCIASDSSQLLMSGGTTGGMNGYNSSIITMTGGTNTFAIYAFNSSTAFFSGSAILAGTFFAQNSSHVFITGGEIDEGLSASGSSTVTYSGGLIFGGISINNSAKLIWAGGNPNGVSAARPTIASTSPLGAPSPGPLSIYLNDSGTLEFDGVNLNATLLDPSNDNGMYSKYDVSGLFADGTQIPSGIDIFVQNPAGAATGASLSLATIPQRWVASSGTWDTAANWSPAIVADGSGAIADFSFATGTITLDGNHTVGSLLILEGLQLDIAQGSGGTLTLNNKGADAVINVSGNHQIFPPIMAQDNTDISISANSSLAIAGGITLAAGKTLSLTSTNLGTLSIPSNSIIGGNLVANAGQLDIEGGAVTGTLTAGGNTKVTLGSGAITGNVMAQGSSNVTLGSGNIQGNLQILNSAGVTMNGGTIGSVGTQDTGQLHIEGGAITGNLSAQGSSKVTLDSGNVQGILQVHAKAIVIMNGGTVGSVVTDGGGFDIEGGTITGNLSAQGSSNNTVNGGNIHGILQVQDNAFVFMTSGTIGGVENQDSGQLYISASDIDGDLNAHGSSYTLISGTTLTGSIDLYDAAQLFFQPVSIIPNPTYAHDTSRLILSGINLSASLVDPSNDGGLFSKYQLNGFYPDGTPIPSGADFFIQNPAGTSPGASFAFQGSGQQWSAVSGSWSNAANWSPAIVADGPSQVAQFENDTAPATIMLDGNRTLGELDLSGAQPITIAQGSGGTLTFDYQGLGAYIGVTGNHQILAPVVLNDDTEIDIDPDSNAPVGSLTLADGVTIGAGNQLSIYDGGVLSIAFIRGGTLDLEQGKVSVIPNGTLAGASNVEALIMQPGTVLDLANNDMLVNNSTFDEIVPLIRAGFANGKWNGTGITSSSAAANPGKALGVLTGAQFLALHPGAQFDGNTVAPADVLIKYTTVGDADLSGTVDATDYMLIDSAFNYNSDPANAGNLEAGWLNGDFNYDGVIDGDDYTLIDNAYNSQGSTSDAAVPADPTEMVATDTSQISNTSGTGVPEPGTLGLLAFGAIGALWRRQRILIDSAPRCSASPSSHQPACEN